LAEWTIGLRFDDKDKDLESLAFTLSKTVLLWRLGDRIPAEELPEELPGERKSQVNWEKIFFFLRKKIKKFLPGGGVGLPLEELDPFVLCPPVPP
jgi:hypothetical protein